MARSKAITAAAIVLTIGLVTTSGSVVRTDLHLTYAQRVQEPGEVGTLSPEEIAAAQRAIADEPPADPTGETGSGSALVAYHAGGRAIGRGGDPRLFRTGAQTLEPSMGIDKQGSVYIDASARQTTGPVFHTVYTVLKSSDEGASWKDSGATFGGQPSHQYSEDPYLYVDPRTSRVFHNDLTFPCQEMSYSDDAGKTWSNAIANCDQADHQNVFAGPPPKGGEQPSGYPNVVYDCAINGGALAGAYSHATSCDKSLDGGTTFTPTGAFPYVFDPNKGDAADCDGATGHGFVGHDGTIYLPKGFCGQPYLAISHDEGASWTRVQVANNGLNGGDDGPPDHLPTTDHEAAVAADYNPNDPKPNLYYFWVGHDYKPYLAISKDDGAHWSKPVMIAPPGVKQAALPALAVSPSARPGRVAVAFMGSTNAPSDPYPHTDDRYSKATWNGYIVETRNALAKNPTFYGGPVNDPSDPFIVGNCAPVRCQAEYDFIDVEVSRSGQPWTVFVDACLDGKTCNSLGEAVVGTVVGGLKL